MEDAGGTQRTVKAIGERGVIDRMRRRLGRLSSVIVGIGDDAAVVRRPRGGWLLFASDMLVEGVHFDRRLVPPQWIGWKALACNVSDIAAMGGLPLWAVVSLGLPPRTTIRFVDGLSRGLQRCARRCGMAVVGGDTVRAPQVIVDVAIVGAVAPRRLVLRSGARVGDRIVVTGRLGGSCRSGRHARFAPRVPEAQALIRRCRVHAMMDISDGLVADLWQIARASRVTLRIEASRVPCSRSAGGLEHALMDGEDFELLAVVERRSARRVPVRIGSTPLTMIGAVVGQGAGVELQAADGRITRVLPSGFQHF